MRDPVVVATKIRKVDENLRKENLEQKRFKTCRRDALLFHVGTPATFKSPQRVVVSRRSAPKRPLGLHQDADGTLPKRGGSSKLGAAELVKNLLNIFG
jgi:hypothetical protein